MPEKENIIASIQYRITYTSVLRPHETEKALQLPFLFYYSFFILIRNRLGKVFYLCFLDCLFFQNARHVRPAKD